MIMNASPSGSSSCSGGYGHDLRNRELAIDILAQPPVPEYYVEQPDGGIWV